MSKDEEQRDDIRADMEAAFAEVEGTDEPETPVEEVVQEPEQEVAEEAAPEAEEPAAEPAEEAAETVVADLKPPAGWTPTAKEKWKDIPADLQQTILDRDREVDRALQDTAEERKLAQNFKQMVDSYAPVFAAEGVQDPMQGLQGLINITAQLQTGSPAAKAERIAGLIKHYGVDIQALDNVLAGEQADPQVSQFEQMLDQRLAPVNQLLSQVQQNAQHQSQQAYTEAGQSVEAFAADPAHEFFPNVKDRMADYIDMQAANGRTDVPLKEAYDFCCGMDPEIKTVLDQRAANEALLSQQQDIGRKQAAASSISGKQAGVVSNTDDLDMRGVLEQAFDSNAL